MARLTRAEQQERTRAAVVVAAEAEFGEHGYLDAKVDRIAERAELTRGAVYSNFPSKRALYLAVLVDTLDRTVDDEPAAPPASVAAALDAFARAWLERLPLVDDTTSGSRLALRSLVGVADDEAHRAVLAQTAQLEALLLAIGLESCAPDDAAPRRVRLAELVLTLLGGAGFLAEMAPGFGDPFDLTRACAHLATLDVDDAWAPPHLPFVDPAELCDDPWTPPAGLVDQLTDAPVDLGADGLVVVLGAGRLGAAEEVVRSARPDEQVTVVVVTGDPAETGGLVRLRLRDLLGCLRRTFPVDTWRPLYLVVTGTDTASAAAAVGEAIGLTEAGDGTEVAVRIRAGRIVARSQERGAGHAVAIADTGRGPRSRTATT